MCHAVPAAASVVTTVLWCKGKDQKIGQLNLMFYGATIFGAIDHLWNGEFFLISPNIAQDLLKGVVISATVLAVWSAGLMWEKMKSSRLSMAVKA